MMLKQIVAAVVAVLAAGTAGFSSSEGSSSCDRECLKGFITQYLDALVARTPEALPVSSDVRFTEDCKELQLGEGLWKTISGLAGYRLDFIDVRQGGTVSFIVVKEGTSSILQALRLRVVDKKISQVETMVVKNQNEGMFFNIKAFTTPSEAMTMTPEAGQLNSRGDMTQIASKYPEGLKTGSFVKVDLQVVENAYRFENGQTMAGPGCNSSMFAGCENLKTQALPTLPKLVYKVAAVDEELGVVVLRMNFGAGSIPNDSKNDLDVFEAFKIYDGKIHAVEAMMQKIPKGTTFGWDYDEVTGVRHPFTTAANPADNVNVKRIGNALAVSLPDRAEGAAVSLYDCCGRQVFAATAASLKTDRTAMVPLDKLPAGFLVGRVECAEGGRTVARRFSVPFVE